MDCQTGKITHAISDLKGEGRLARSLRPEDKESFHKIRQIMGMKSFDQIINTSSMIAAYKYYEFDEKAEPGYQSQQVGTIDIVSRKPLSNDSRIVADLRKIAEEKYIPILVDYAKSECEDANVLFGS